VPWKYNQPYNFKRPFSDSFFAVKILEKGTKNSSGIVMHHFSSIFVNRRCILPVFLFIFCVVLLPTAVFSELVDKVVAIVNDDIITLSEVEEEAAGLYMAIARNDSGEPMQQALDQARAKTLNTLITRKLVAQKADQYHISVSDKEIENGLKKSGPVPT
jgi:peptidyl-prolyl cis-trans isomerase SurA